MNCRYSENDVALYVEGDLDPARSGELERHFASCEACRVLAGELRESQTALKGLRQETVSAAALAYMRTRVLTEVAGGHTGLRWGRWVYAIAGFGFAAAL